MTYPGDGYVVSRRDKGKEEERHTGDQTHCTGEGISPGVSPLPALRNLSS